MSEEAIVAALAKLIKAEPETEHLFKFWDEANDEKNHRGAAILVATNVENALQSSIVRNLRIGEKLQKELFGPNGAMGTFAFKIKIGYAVRIYGEETRRNLDIIRHLRNTFAHARTPISFDDPTVIAACNLLALPTLVLYPKAIPARPAPVPEPSGRQRYQRVCNDTAHNLYFHTFHGPKPIQPSEVSARLLDGYEVWAKQQPLP